MLILLIFFFCVKSVEIIKPLFYNEFMLILGGVMMGRKLKRIFAFVCVFLMVLGMLSGIGPSKNVVYADGGFLFDATKLPLNGIQNKDPVPEGTTFADSYYKVMGNVTYRTQNDEMIALELGKNLTGSFEFTSVGEADIVLVVASTGGANTSAFAIVDASGNVVPNTENASTCTGTGGQRFDYKAVPAGSYSVVSPVNEELNRGLRLISIEVLDYAAGAREPRADWTKVAPPVITDVKAEGANINVYFDMLIGYDGADQVIVELINSSNKTVDTVAVAAEGENGVATFTPSASDTYSFRLQAKRTGEVKKNTSWPGVDFLLPLKQANVSSATSAGNGTATVRFGSVPEADSYTVYYKKTSEKEYTKGETVTSLYATVTGLSVGERYDFAVQANRREESAKIGSSASCLLTEEAQREWAFAAFGPGADTTNNFYKGSANEAPYTVSVSSLNNKGKLQPTSTDGLAFYYTTIDPETENFVFSATITVDSWTFTNGQDGFGLMACDRVGAHGDGSVFWNNSYMATCTKVEYWFDNETGELFSSSGDGRSKVSMKLGLGAQEKLGVTNEFLANDFVNTTDFAQNYFKSTMFPLEDGGRIYSKGNIVGNVTNPSSDMGTYAELTTFKLKIERNNTGYILSYEDPNGKIHSKLYYDIERDNLTQLDPEHIYVGFYAARTFNITVSDISITTSDPKTDAPAEERKLDLTAPVVKGVSAAAVGDENYKFIGYANADGTCTIIDRASQNIIAENVQVKANEYFTADVKLKKGVNGIVMKFTPDADYKPNGEFSALTDYSTVSVTHEVTYKRLSGTVIYVGPEGDAYNKGTKESPYDLATAMTHAHKGQTIYILDGTYKLTEKITVGRGQSGTESEPIYLLPDPEGTSRPVFDFQSKDSGITIGGDYWYVGGFDVTHSTGKGLQISGNYCTADRVDAYYNENTGIQISRLSSTDVNYSDWPHDNLILNCTSYGNADPGYEDADGFACKLTTGDNNVFDGCLSYNNADDGWDMFAKVETGAVGSVLIKNCVCYGNGYLPDGTNAGNGNGFKLGGSSITGYHKLVNCVSFNNKMKGIDSNSCPDIQVENCVSYNNGSYNVAFYTNDAKNTDYCADGLVSFKDNSGEGDNIKPKGEQDNSKIYKTSNYYWQAGNTEGIKAEQSWFETTDTSVQITRNADGTLNMNGFLVMSENAPEGVGAFVGGTPSIDFTALKVNVPDAEPTETPMPTQEVSQTPEDTIDATTEETTGNTDTSGDTNGMSGTSDNTVTPEGGVGPAGVVAIVLGIALIIGAVVFFIFRKKTKD